MDKSDKTYNNKRPNWSYRVPPDLREDLESLLNRLGSKQKVFDYLIRLGLEKHKEKIEEELIDYD